MKIITILAIFHITSLAEVIAIIYITGDTHGEQARIYAIQSELNLTSEDTLIVCGDFGFIFRDTLNEKAFLNELENLPFTICFVDGNHENFNEIFKYPMQIWNDGKIHRIRKNVIHLMRGQIFTIENQKIFTFGGAYSIDRYMRKLDYSYWNQELPSKDEYNEAIQNLKNHNNCVDYILTHTCPKEIVRMIHHLPDEHDIELTGFLEYLMYELKFKHWYFGHWHIDKQITNKFTALWFDTITL